jgi:hypothetical protein
MKEEEQGLRSALAESAPTRDHSLAGTDAEPSASFTPGPWVKDRHGQLSGPDGTIVCTKGLGLSISLGGDPYPVAEANARLIAAAPDMYEALEEAEEALRDTACHGPGAPCARYPIKDRYGNCLGAAGDGTCGKLAGDALVKVLAALAKAQGSQS